LSPIIGRASAAIRRCMEDTLGAGALSDDRWAQCCLPLRSTGLGIKDPALLADCCRVSASLSYLSRAPALAFPPTAIGLPPDFLPTALRLRNTIDPAFGPLPTWVTPALLLVHPFPPPEPSHRSQQWWSKALYSRLADSLYASSTTRDQCRLRLQAQPFTSAWMLTVPHDGVPHVFQPTHYRAALRWWLGIPLYAGDSFHPCPMCGGPMDPFGDHLVSCPSNHLTERHHGVRDALTEVLRSLGVPCMKEVSLPSRPERPGDVALPDFDPRGPLLVDLCAIHPLAPSRDYHPDTIIQSLADKEKQKIDKYSALCARDAYFFSPLSFHLWGGLGPAGSSLLKRIIRQVVGDAPGWTKIHRTMLIRQRISFALLSAVAEQLHPPPSVGPRFTLPPGLLVPPPPLPLPLPLPPPPSDHAPASASSSPTPPTHLESTMDVDHMPPGLPHSPRRCLTQPRTRRRPSWMSTPSRLTLPSPPFRRRSPHHHRWRPTLRLPPLAWPPSCGRALRTPRPSPPFPHWTETLPHPPSSAHSASINRPPLLPALSHPLTSPFLPTHRGAPSPSHG
jgi:hypothetical protein